MDEIHVHKTKKSICAHFAKSPCTKCIHKTFAIELLHHWKVKSVFVVKLFFKKF